jgi:uncharacterized alkaline shock family protein YloU
VPDGSPPGRALATRQAIADIVRSVVLGSYGVVELGGRPIDRMLSRLGRRRRGVAVSIDGGRIAIDVRLRVAHGVPVAEVARQLESAVRFAIRRALRRDVDHLTIRISGLAPGPASAPPRPLAVPSIRSSELADSGTDVA